jgi:hypothetical protein
MNAGTDQPAGSGGVGPDSIRLEPTEDERTAAAAVLRMIWGIHISRAVYVAADLGLADRLAGGPMTSAELAQATQTHEPALYRILRVQPHFGPDDPAAVGTLAGVIRTAAPLIERTGVASAKEIGVETFAQRLTDDLQRNQAVFAHPVLLSAWATTDET